MPRYAVMLRGVNVGRANRVPMAEFRALLESAGYGDVRTLLNSGNAVFSCKTGASRMHAGRIRWKLSKRLGVDVPVIVKSTKEFAAITAGNALAEFAPDASRLLVAFASDARALAALAPIASRVRAPEKWHLGRHAAYLWCANGILKSTAAAALLGAHGKAATTRNWATVLKMAALLGEDNPPPGTG
jgi:uncharacterized protein (DUF1697 family)